MLHPVVFDIETQYIFQEVANDIKKLKVSVVGTYDYGTDQYICYEESQLPKLFEKFEHAEVLIGFNSNKFDLPVLQPYYVGDITQFPSFDILAEVEKVLGHRISLDDLAKATLGTKKSGHGLQAIEWYRAGEMEKLKQYCLMDVKITKEIYDYGVKYGRLFYSSPYGKREFSVKFKRESSTPKVVSLSLPF
jgi:DEAD/DEAH box helicase domain-containing protein